MKDLLYNHLLEYNMASSVMLDQLSANHKAGSTVSQS